MDTSDCFILLTQFINITKKDQKKKRYYTRCITHIRNICDNFYDKFIFDNILLGCKEITDFRPRQSIIIRRTLCDYLNNL